MQPGTKHSLESRLLMSRAASRRWRRRRKAADRRALRARLREELEDRDQSGA